MQAQVRAGMCHGSWLTGGNWPSPMLMKPGMGLWGNGAAPTVGGGSRSPGLHLPLRQALAVPVGLLAFLGSGGPRRSGFLLR